ncbi:MAG: adenylosuccinate synthase [Candidatus Zixiibacteriota bacterium]
MTRKPNRAVLGLLWGDEGKAKIIDLLGKYANMIVRFQGGANAGHTVMVNDHKTVLHQIPCGILRKDTLCILGAGMVVNLKELFEEIAMLKQNGVDITDRLYMSPRTHIVTPLGKTIEKLMEKENKIGTTLRGIGPTYSEKALRTGFRAGDIVHNKDFPDMLKKQYKRIKNMVNATDGIDMPEYSHVLESVYSYRKELAKLVRPCYNLVNEAMQKGIGVLFEGAQGSMLDIDWGTYPFVTSSNTTIGGLVSGAGVDPRMLDQVIGVTKVFTTRVGDGPFPTEMPEKQAKHLRGTGDKPWDEFGATTGRPRRIGWLDGIVLRYAVTINGVDALAVTKMDTLDGLDEIKICRSYWVDGEITEDFPATIKQLEMTRPIYDTLPGWTDETRGITKFSDLPENARKFVKHIEEITGIPVILVSTGPNRAETIVVHHK